MVNPSLTSFSVHAKMGGSRGFKGENSLAGFPEKYSIKKPDIGKSCIRFKNLNAIPFDLIADLCGKVTADQWNQLYDSALKK